MYPSTSQFGVSVFSVSGISPQLYILCTAQVTNESALCVHSFGHFTNLIITFSIRNRRRRCRFITGCCYLSFCDNFILDEEAPHIRVNCTQPRSRRVFGAILHRGTMIIARLSLDALCGHPLSGITGDLPTEGPGPEGKTLLIGYCCCGLQGSSSSASPTLLLSSSLLLPKKKRRCLIPMWTRLIEHTEVLDSREPKSVICTKKYPSGGLGKSIGEASRWFGSRIGSFAGTIFLAIGMVLVFFWKSWVSHEFCRYPSQQRCFQFRFVNALDHISFPIFSCLKIIFNIFYSCDSVFANFSLCEYEFRWMRILFCKGKPYNYFLFQ